MWTRFATMSNAWPHALPASGLASEFPAARSAHRPGAVAVSAGCAAGRYAGRALAEADAAVRAARFGRGRGDATRRALAHGAAGTGPDLRQVRPDLVHPARPGAAGRGRRARAAAGSG